MYEISGSQKCVLIANGLHISGFWEITQYNSRYDVLVAYTHRLRSVRAGWFPRIRGSQDRGFGGRVSRISLRYRTVMKERHEQMIQIFALYSSGLVVR
jgi:hypothetical protein